jgi:polar amino acid transport system substrate-binding protein
MKVWRRTRLCGLVAVGAALAAVAAGCGTTTEDTGGAAAAPEQQQDSSLAAKLPADVKSAGVLRIGTDPTYPPFESMGSDNKTVIGLDADLGKAIGDVLGVKTKMVPTAWDGIIPALKAERFDLIMSSMDDTAEREQQVDYVNYMKVPAYGLLVAKGNPDGLKTLDQLCGKTVSVQKGTTQADYAAEEAKKCDKPMSLRQFPSETDAQLQVRTGRAAAEIVDQVVAVYVASSKGGAKLDAVELPNQPPSIKGIAVSKKRAELRDAVQAALAKLAQDGGYQGVLKKWGFPGAAIDEITINAGGK